MTETHKRAALRVLWRTTAVDWWRLARTASGWRAFPRSPGAMIASRLGMLNFRHGIQSRKRAL